MSTTIYTYTARDGETITGTAAEIVAAVHRWHGDGVFLDNPEPTTKYFDIVATEKRSEDVDDADMDEPRAASRSELVAWLARAEDRPLHVTDRALVGPEQITVRVGTFEPEPSPTGWLVYRHESGKHETLEFRPHNDSTAHLAERWDKGGEVGTVDGMTTIVLGRVAVVQHRHDDTVTVEWPGDWDLADFEHLGIVRRLSGMELAAWRHLLGLTRQELASALQVRDDTLKAWEVGKDRIPLRVREELGRLDEMHRALVDRIVAGREPFVVERSRVPGPGVVPAGWDVAAVARAMVQDPGVVARWAGQPT